MSAYKRRSLNISQSLTLYCFSKTVFNHWQIEMFTVFLLWFTNESNKKIYGVSSSSPFTLSFFVNFPGLTTTHNDQCEWDLLIGMNISFLLNIFLFLVHWTTSFSVSFFIISLRNVVKKLVLRKKFLILHLYHFFLTYKG